MAHQQNFLKKMIKKLFLVLSYLLPIFVFKNLTNSIIILNKRKKKKKKLRKGQIQY